MTRNFTVASHLQFQFRISNSLESIVSFIYDTREKKKKKKKIRDESVSITYPSEPGLRVDDGRAALSEKGTEKECV